MIRARRARCALAVVGVACLVGSFLPSAASAATTGADVKKLEQQVADARSRANAVAAKLSAAYAELSDAEDAVAASQAALDQTSAALDAERSAVRDLAVAQYVEGLQSPAVDVESAVAAGRAQVMLDVASGSNANSVDAYRAVRIDLEARTATLEQALAAQAAKTADLKAQQDAAVKETERLAAAERELEAKLKVSKAAEAKKLGGSITTNGSWACPVAGTRAFTNDWGMPRSGGRRHQGTDILAPRGTPVVAPVDGTVTQRSVSLGGRSFYLQGVDGNKYFGTHLNAYGTSGSVKKGTVIGYVGDDGNARGGPTHLHFEIHPGGGRAVNPFPTLRQFC